ncbi:unnamed protein product [Mytilus coruscus]|uniref:Uncharacterized protein n=1 Tax=Mytilus coruscus TaxID=42192 RepID=A0A6J8DKQ7_MYTCO|nr:unnamed protein product [Mytilus coruscus]
MQYNKTVLNSDESLINVTGSMHSNNASTENNTLDINVQNVQNNSEQPFNNSSESSSTSIITTATTSTSSVSDSSDILIQSTTVLDILNKSVELIPDHLQNMTSYVATTENPKLTTGSIENKTMASEIKVNGTQIQESTTEASIKTTGEPNILHTTEKKGSTKQSDVDKTIVDGINATAETNRTDGSDTNNATLFNNSRINSVSNKNLPKLDLMATTAVVIITSQVNDHNAQTTQSTPNINITAPLFNQTDQSPIRLTTIGEKETRNTKEPPQSLGKTTTTTTRPVTKVTISKMENTVTVKGTSEKAVNSINLTDTTTSKTTAKVFTERSTEFTTKAGIQMSVTRNNEIAAKSSSQKTVEKDMYKTSEIGGFTENWMEFNISGFGVISNLEVHSLGDKEDDRYWPVVVAVTIGIPAIIIIGVTIIVMHRKRLGRRSLSRPNKLAYA